MNTPASTLIELVRVDVASARTGDRVIADVNWTIRSGDRWVVAGVHGAGKSDLISTAAGLQKPLNGSVVAFDRDCASLADPALTETRTRIGIVFKNGGRMFAHLTVAENIALPLRYRFDWTYSQAADAVDKILKLTGLESHAQSTASAMGGNWLQRVGLARALALKPEVLFLDEPLAGLESRHRQWWQGFLGQLADGIPWNDHRPTAVIITTNTPENWSAWGRCFARIDENRWIASCPTPASADLAPGKPSASSSALTTPASDAAHRRPGP
jgi:ABC-type transporter Mla maintaining outer membrane lipid asymmetry ATPase subunit MlaF